MKVVNNEQFNLLNKNDNLVKKSDFVKFDWQIEIHNFPASHSLPKRGSRSSLPGVYNFDRLF